MATEASGVVPIVVSPPPQQTENPTPNPTPTPAPTAESAANAQANAPKMSNAELKAKVKAEKAARRAQVKEAKAVPIPPIAQTGAAGGDGKGGGKSGKGKQDAQLQSPGGAPGQGRSGGHQRRPSGMGQRPSIVAAVVVEKDVRSDIPDCFSHIPMAKRIATSQAHKDVHPAALALGQQMATFTVRDSIARLKCTLLAFKQVIASYETPKGNSLSRHFVPHVLNPQIEYLTECRPMCLAMGNAIRFLKTKINEFDIDTPEQEAKDALLESIDTFINERITLAELVIARNAASMVGDGDVILTYGSHRLVQKTLLQARREGKRFEVAIVDDPFDQTGQDLAKVLRREGVRVFYSPNLGGLRLQVRRSTKVFLGAEAMFANGSLYGPAGTCDVAMAAADASIPVIALCETISFDRDRVPTDSLTYNEIDPERCSADNFRLLFDTTRSKYLEVVVTEYESETGNAPAQAILAILRKQEDQV